MNADNNKMASTFGRPEQTAMTVEGEPPIVSEDGSKLFISGEKSGVAQVTIANVKQSNGVIHVISSVDLPG